MPNVPEQMPAPLPFMVESYAADQGVSLAEAERRLAAQDKSAAWDVRLRNRFGDRYAGIHFDNAQGRMFANVVTSEDATTAHNLGVKAGLTFGAVGDARVRLVEATYADLNATAQQLSAELASEIAADQAVVGIDPSRNAVLVTETRAVAGQPTAQQAVAGAEAQEGNVIVEVVADDDLAMTPTYCEKNWNIKKADCDPPLRGGVRIVPSNFNPDAPTENPAPGKDNGCTLGFIARSPADGFGFLTAGHCIGLLPWINCQGAWNCNNTYYGRGPIWEARCPGCNPQWPDIGRATWWYFQTGAGDGAFVTSEWPDGHWHNPDTRWPMVAAWCCDEHYLIYGRRWSFVGQYICRFGRSTGWACGYVTRVDIGGDASWQDGYFETNYRYPFNNTAGSGEHACAIQGDSGGPFIENGLAVGIQSSQNWKANGDCITWAEEVLDAEVRVGAYVYFVGA